MSACYPPIPQKERFYKSPKTRFAALTGEGKVFMSFTGREPLLHFLMERFYKPVERQWGKNKGFTATENEKWLLELFVENG